MTAINFPDSPSDGDTHVVGGVTYTYNNAETKWKTTINSNAFLPLSGGTVSGNILMGGEIQHDGDTDTNIAFDTDTILFDTAGSERFRVGSAGQLGIGGATYGSDGQVLTSGGASAAPAWEDLSVLFESYAILEDQKTQNTNGGTFSTGAWRTRDLNTEVADPDSIVTIATNQFTLAAGTYFISWSAPAFNSGSHQSALFDSTNTTYYYGSSAYSADASNVQSRSFGSVRITITGSTVFEIRHRTDNGNSNNGFGVCSNFATEVYTRVEILKEA